MTTGSGGSVQEYAVAPQFDTQQGAMGLRPILRICRP